MQDTADIVADIWKSHSNYLGGESVAMEAPEILEPLVQLFCPGSYSYYYIINSPTLTFDLVSPSVLTTFGIDADKFTLDNLLNRLHPDDVPYFLRCEDLVAHFLKKQISPEKIVKYKIAYCIRLKIHDGSFRLFLVQTLTLRTTPEGALLKVFGSQTDVSALIEENNYRLSFIGLDGEECFIGIDVFSDDVFKNFEPFTFTIGNMLFTRRELDVLKLLSKGLSTQDISKALNISRETVITHRKNMIRKSGCKNSIDLIVRCVRKGYV